MSIADCINRAVDAGQLSRPRAAAAQALFRQRMNDYAHLGQGAEAAAWRDVWTQLRVDHQKRKRGTLLQAQASERIIRNVSEFRDSAGNRNPAKALRELVEWGQQASFQSVAGIQQALTNQYRAGIGKFIMEHKRNLAGSVTNKTRLPDIVRELMGEGTGSQSAKQMSDAIAHTFEQARLNFNAAGGAIAKLDDFGLPHAWDRVRMLAAHSDRKTARSMWTQEITGKLDWDRIPDNATGKPFSGSTDAARQKFLEDIWDTITESGWNKREPSGLALGRSKANSRSDHRVLHFKSADDWMAANDAYGKADVFAAVITHLDMMARDTAMMRVLGPNPRAGLEMARQTALKLANEDPWTPGKKTILNVYRSPEAEVNDIADQANNMLDIVSGAANDPGMDVMASALSGTRHFLIASQLGGAMLSAVSDVGFVGMASRHVGMKPSKVMARQLKAIASSKDRAVMARMNIIAESAANVGVAQARLMGDAYGPAVMERLSEFTMRASGLTAWTDIGRGSFRMEFYGYLAENAGRSWDELDRPLRELVFETRGINRNDWEVIRKTTLHTDRDAPDATFLVPSQIANRTDIPREQALDLSLKLESAILEQMEFAVPSASIRGRSVLAGGKPGTFVGELTRSGVMYKSFAMSMLFNQLGRVLFHKTNGSRAANVALLATVTTLAGAMSIQLKEMAKGRDPRDMTDKAFWPAAILQGGGLGIFGDFAAASENRFGGGIAQTFAGPMVGLGNDALYLTNDIVKALYHQDSEHNDKLGRSATKMLDRYSGPTNVWYVATALDRALWDNLQAFVDGDADKAFRRAETRRVNKFGNDSYWGPGDPVPTRAPDLTQAIGG